MPGPLLRIDGLTRHFGGVQAVNDVSFAIDEGTIFGLIGPNGAGKTTLVNLITGYLGAQRGSILMGDVELAGRRPHQVAALGVGRTFQSIRLYRELTALENVLIGMHSRRRNDTLQQMALLPVFRRGQQERVREARELMRRVGLDDQLLGRRRAGTLSYGDQRRLEVARALALRPRLLILDEPAAGMNPAEKERIRELIEQVNAQGLTVLLIDHDMRLVMGVCRQVVVLDFGEKIADGSPTEVSSNPAVVTAYLGARAQTEGVHAPGSIEVTETLERKSSGDAASQPQPGATSMQAARAAGREILQVTDLDVRYGAVRAVRDVSFMVAEGEIVALIGANGAGKSTILKCLSGLIRPRAGSASFDGLDLATAGPDRIVAHGLVQVPEGREALARLSVRENLELATWSRRGSRGGIRREIAEMMERFPILGRRRDLPAGQLSGGEQQIMVIARGLLAKPRLLLLDEPSLGLAPQMVDTVFEVIEGIHREGVTVLLVEQNALRALEVADRAYVVERGTVLLSGAGADLLSNPEVRKAYLGISH
ncbi:MAG TPA: ATP-binding cassette domain-containing protein [Candidatus Dormibacteraeota bacterium]|jgi:ABC-type branched-subunit amino acid transport system ATPase component